MTESQTIHQKRLVPTLVGVTFPRLMLNGARRFPYIILTPMAAALGIPRSYVEVALSAQWAVGAFSPLIGGLIDRVGSKRIMLISIGGFAVFMVMSAVGQTVGILLMGFVDGSVAKFIGAAIVLSGLVASGVAKIIYDPAMEAYVGHHTPYERRGMAIGITELAWSGSLFVFGPLTAYLIVNASLGAIFGVLAGSSVFALVLMWRIVPADHPTEAHQEQPKISTRAAFKLLSNPSVIAFLLAAALISTAAESVNIIYEEWLRNSFAIDTEALGKIVWIFAIAEVLGEGLVIVLADRVGKRSLAMVTIVVTGSIYLLLPLLGMSGRTAVILLFLMFLFFEISVVVLIPMATEVLPQARGVMMTTNIACVSLGRAVGTLLGGWMFRTGGIAMNGTVAMILSLIAAVLLWRFVVERD